MIKRKKVIFTGVGTLLAVGAALITWRKREREKRQAKREKQKIEKADYISVNERDIAWG